MLDHEIEAFGRRLGLEHLALSSEGIARLDIEHVGSLYLVRQENAGIRELLVYVSAPLPVPDGGATRRLLESCDYRRGYPVPVFAGAFSGRALLLTRMEENAVTAAGLENALRFLAELLHEAL